VSVDLLQDSEVPDYAKRLEDACAEAIAQGLEVVEAKANQLFCDLDDKRDLDVFRCRSEWLVRAGIASGWKITRSKSGNSHGYVTLKSDTPALERIALQAILGSDRTHEYLNFLTYKKLGESMRIVFFETPQGKA
jgi:hypothetical protein